MNEIATQEQQVTTAQPFMPTTSVGMARESTGSRIAPQNLGEVIKFAEVMSRAGKMLPPHLQGDVGACMAIALQALDWQMNPFAVASKSYFVSNRVAYEAQLIAAVVNTRSGIRGRLRYEFEGEGDKLFCRVTGTLDGTLCVYETPPIGSITVKNSPLWKSDPKQQLGYYAARSWARRHCPEVILGVYDRDEAAEMKDVSPPAGTGLAARLSEPQGGFDPSGVSETLSEASAAVAPAAATDAAVADEVVDPETGEVTTKPAAPPAEKPKGKKAKPLGDTDLQRSGAQAFLDGKPREVPGDLFPGDNAEWLSGYDRQAGSEKL